jgi:hypothetical protein
MLLTLFASFSINILSMSFVYLHFVVLAVARCQLPPTIKRCKKQKYWSRLAIGETKRVKLKENGCTECKSEGKHRRQIEGNFEGKLESSFEGKRVGTNSATFVFEVAALSSSSAFVSVSCATLSRQLSASSFSALSFVYPQRSHRSQRSQRTRANTRT